MLYQILDAIFWTIIIGPHLAEFAGMLWHYRVAHLGDLRWIGNDFLRARHYDHHYNQYPENRLQTNGYHSSCDTTFYPLIVLVPLALYGLVWIGVLSKPHFLFTILGATLFASVLDFSHRAFHIRYSMLKKGFLFRYRWIRKRYAWRRRYHNIHHKKRKNYFIIFPCFDLFLGTLERDTSSSIEDLFPGFNPRLISNCDTPLFPKK